MHGTGPSRRNEPTMDHRTISGRLSLGEMRFFCSQWAVAPEEARLWSARVSMILPLRRPRWMNFKLQETFQRQSNTLPRGIQILNQDEVNSWNQCSLFHQAKRSITLFTGADERSEKHASRVQNLGYRLFVPEVVPILGFYVIIRW